MDLKFTDLALKCIFKLGISFSLFLRSKIASGCKSRLLGTFSTAPDHLVHRSSFRESIVSLCLLPLVIKIESSMYYREAGYFDFEIELSQFCLCILIHIRIHKVKGRLTRLGSSIEASNSWR